jgi:hypothetical protein
MDGEIQSQLKVVQLKAMKVLNAIKVEKAAIFEERQSQVVLIVNM